MLLTRSGTTPYLTFSIPSTASTILAERSNGSLVFITDWNINHSGVAAITGAGALGAGTVSPQSMLDVAGGAAIGSYAGTTAAPSNGMIVSGVVGIGTTTPRSTLDVAGGIAVGTSYAGTIAAPSNGMIVQGGVAIGTSAFGATALLYVKDSTGSNGSAAVYGITTVGPDYGVYGINNAASSGSGVYGSNNGTGPGVYGKNSSTGAAVEGWNSGGTGNGVYGLVTGGSGTGNGVYGSISGSGNGVYGHNSGSGSGVYGDSSSGIGGYFTSTSGYALITGTGNVGIGIATPATALQVNGTVTATQFSGSGAGLSSTTVPVASINASGSLSSSTYLRGDGTWATIALGTGTTGTLPVGSLSGTPTGGSGPYNQVYVNAQGLVTSEAFVPVTLALGSSAAIPSPYGQGADTNTGLYTAGTGKVDVTSGGTQIAEFNSGGFNVVNGKVGIGTTSPGGNLDVYTTSGSTYIRAKATATGGQAILSLDRGTIGSGNSSAVSLLTNGTEDWVLGTSEGPGTSDFSIYDGGTSTYPFYIVKSSGNVGIGTSSPAMSLDLSANSDGTKLQTISASAGASCTSTQQGAIRYNSNLNNVEFCNGSNWVFLAAGSSSCGTPSGLSFTNVTGASLVTLYSSNTATITFTGCTTGQSASVTGAVGAQISINGGTWVTSGIITSGQTLQVRLTSSSLASTVLTATVTVGSTNANWTVTTRAGSLKIFETANNYTGGGIGGLSGADTICQTEAGTAGYAGTYKALLSDATTGAASRVTLSYPIVNAYDGTTVAGSNLWSGTLTTHIKNPSGNNPAFGCGYTNVWTGSSPVGAVQPDNCSSWSSTSATGGEVGLSASTGSGWISLNPSYSWG